MSFSSALILLFPSFCLLWVVFVVVPRVLVGIGLGCLFELFLSFLRWAYIAMNFPLRTAFAVSHRFWVVVSSFSFVCRKFLISSLILFLTHSLFKSMIFNLCHFECWVFSLKLVCSFCPLWSEKMLDMISIFLNLLRLALCPIMWSIFEKVPWTHFLKRMCILLLWDEKLSLYIS